MSKETWYLAVYGVFNPSIGRDEKGRTRGVLELLENQGVLDALCSTPQGISVVREGSAGFQTFENIFGRDGVLLELVQDYQSEGTGEVFVHRARISGPEISGRVLRSLIKNNSKTEIYFSNMRDI